LKIAYFSGVRYGHELLATLLEKNFEVSIVFSYEHSKKKFYSDYVSFEDITKKYGIKHVCVKNINDGENLRLLQKIQPDLLLVMGWSQILRKEILKEACIKSGKILGIRSIDFLDFPDMRLDTIPHLEINIKLEKIIKKFRPEVVYTTPSNDLNLDHRKVFESTLVVTRPFECSVKNVLSYEIPGQVKDLFEPTLFENITKYFSSKVKAFQCYKSEVKKFPHSRSIEAIENLAIQRGIESGLKKAEAFKVIRSISE